jgi:polyribonucleotide 5'-hydroxyl-kinase
MDAGILRGLCLCLCLCLWLWLCLLSLRSIARTSGLVINTCGMVEGLGRQLLVHAATTFKVHVILVLDDDRLENALKQEKALVDAGVAVAKLAKSGGVVKRETPYRQRQRSRLIRAYFYGPANEYHPHTREIGISELRVFRVGGGLKAPTSTLPIGQKSLLDPSQLQPVPITAQLQGHILGVSFAKKAEDLLKENVAGYVHV